MFFPKFTPSKPGALAGSCAALVLKFCKFLPTSSTPELLKPYLLMTALQHPQALLLDCQPAQHWARADRAIFSETHANVTCHALLTRCGQHISSSTSAAMQCGTSPQLWESEDSRLCIAGLGQRGHRACIGHDQYRSMQAHCNSEFEKASCATLNTTANSKCYLRTQLCTLNESHCDLACFEFRFPET